MIFSMFYQTQRSQLGILTLDILVREQLDLPSNATKYPVEDGGPDVSDHITQGNEELQIRGSVASSDIDSFVFWGGGFSKLIDAVQSLREMHSARDVVTVVTGLGMYEDMAFTKLNFSRTNDSNTGGGWIEIDASLIKIRKVALRQADLPPEQVSSPETKGKTGKTEKKGQSSGTSSPEPVEKKRTSMLMGVARGTGAIA